MYYIFNIIKKGMAINLFPESVAFLYDSYLARFLRLLGSFCVIISLGNCFEEIDSIGNCINVASTIYITYV
jgi:hypothetical protein